MSTSPVICLVQDKISNGQTILMLLGLVATAIGSIFLIRYLARSAGLAFGVFLCKRSRGSWTGLSNGNRWHSV